MSTGGCYDKIRFTLNDSSGVLRFESFDIVDSPECTDIARTLREYLVGRPLAEVDLEYISGLWCWGNAECMKTVVQVIQEHRELFFSGASD